jgi:hypothetical protein
MNTVEEMLRDADPLRDERRRPDVERDRVRQAVLAAVSDGATPAAAWFRRRVTLAAVVVLILVGIVAVGSRIWSQGGATLQAAVRFEVRLAEAHPAAGLREARVAGTDRVVYVHEEIIVTNDDVTQSRVVQGDGPSHFGVGVEFNAAGAEKLRRATANHIGGPVAILIDGDVVAVPVLRDPIGNSAVISGDFSRAEAERIVSGIGLR